jgi:hypothetical protein
MAKPPVKIKTPDSDSSAGTSTTTRAPSETIQPSANPTTTGHPDFHWQGRETTFETLPREHSPDIDPPSKSAIMITDLPVLGRSSPEFPHDMHIHRPALDGDLVLIDNSGISRSRDGSLYAHMEDIGDVLIRINSNGQYEIKTASAHLMVLEKIDGKPLWRKKNAGSHPTKTGENEPSLELGQPVSLNELIIPRAYAKSLTTPDTNGIRRDTATRPNTIERIYVDLENGTTVMVVPTGDGRYQATTARVLIPDGPILERIGGTTQWRIEETSPGPSKRPRLEQPVDTVHTATQPAPSDPDTVWNGRWQPNAGGPIRPFALLHSRHAAKFRFEKNSWTSQNPFYPFTSEIGRRAHYKALLEQGSALLKAATSADNIKLKIETFTQWGMKIDLHSLAFFKLPGQVVTEVKTIDGGLIADLVNQQSNGQATIQRIIEPMAGSGFYANYARAVGFEGDMIINDVNPLISWSQKEIIQQPDRVKYYIDSIKEDLVALGKQYGFEFNPVNLSIKFKSKQDSREFVKTEPVKNFRDAVKNYFNEVVDVVVELKNGELVISDPPTRRASVSAQLQDDELVISLPPPTANEKAFLAAVFYITQNNNQRNTGIVEIRKVKTGNHSLHFPVAMMFTDGPTVKLFSVGLANNDHINYISHLHASAMRPTHFANEDGWTLLDSLRDESKNKGDLIILSGHFSDTYLSVEAFITKIVEHVMPLSNNGAKVIIANAYSPQKETAFNTLGFHTFKKSRDSNPTGKSTNMAKGDYLLAINRSAMQAAQSL